MLTDFPATQPVFSQHPNGAGMAEHFCCSQRRPSPPSELDVAKLLSNKAGLVGHMESPGETSVRLKFSDSPLVILSQGPLK